MRIINLAYFFVFLRIFYLVGLLVGSEESKYNSEKTNDDNTGRLFEVRVINSYGHSEKDNLPDDGTAITFKSMFPLSF